MDGRLHKESGSGAQSRKSYTRTESHPEKKKLIRESINNSLKATKKQTRCQMRAKKSWCTARVLPPEISAWPGSACGTGRYLISGFLIASEWICAQTHR